MLANLSAMIVSGVAALLLTPLVRHMAQKLDVIDKPDRKRKHHRRLVPLWGGLAIALSMFLGLGISFFLTGSNDLMLEYREGFFLKKLPWTGAACLILFFSGLFDDVRPLPPKVKLLMQFLASVLIVLGGIYFTVIIFPGMENGFSLWQPFGIAITILWVLFMINSFNFIDGVDGLASGQAIISGIGLMAGGMIIAYQSQSLMTQYYSRMGAVLAAAVAGSALGFYRYNRWPAKIFLGDAGSAVLGFTLCLSGTLIIHDAEKGVVPIMVIMCLGWPIIDTLQVIVRRLLRGEPISRADNRHLHHELQKQGFTKTATVALINMLSIIFVVIGIVILWL